MRGALGGVRVARGALQNTFAMPLVGDAHLTNRKEGYAELCLECLAPVFCNSDRARAARSAAWEDRECRNGDCSRWMRQR